MSYEQTQDKADWGEAVKKPGLVAGLLEAVNILRDQLGALQSDLNPVLAQNPEAPGRDAVEPAANSELHEVLLQVERATRHVRDLRERLVV